MKFNYLELEAELSPSTKRTKKFYRPIIPAILMYKTNYVGYQALIDSGSDYCIFESAVANYLGISLTSGKKRHFFGINGEKVKGYEHNIKLKLAGKIYNTTVIFSREIPENSFGVLGSKGFFDHFKVILDYKNKNIELK